ncbi:MAG: hypothetical protein HEP71_07360 [Roseivirga sp.]|nr:hypothetical protein [Roseivirga sp.]
MHRVYVYADIDGILLMSKETAIVERNRIENPLIRVSETEVNEFYQQLGLSRDGVLLPPKAELPNELMLDEDQLRSLFSMLNKEGHCLVTSGTAQVDELHNLVFGTNYQTHIHIDHDINRLKMVNGKLGAHTYYVFCDAEIMPFHSHCVDGYFSFNPIMMASKEVQKELYFSLKDALKPATVGICLICDEDRDYLQAFYKSDVLSGRLKPWKRCTLPAFHFQKTEYRTQNHMGAISNKRSFGSQFLKA